MSEFPQLPSKHFIGEQLISPKNNIFDSCEEAFNEIVGQDVFIIEKSYSKTEKWGYIMRVIFNDFTDKGQKLPASSFVCWKKSEYSENVAIRPLEE
jgi:hypothetical protein